MKFDNLVDAVPTTFKIVGLSNRYWFHCRECSYRHDVSKKKIRQAGWDSIVQHELSEELERHNLWHQNNPTLNWDVERKKRLDQASQEAMKQLNRVFGKMFR